MDRMRTAISERYNTHTLYLFMKGVIAKIIAYNNRFPHYDATKKNYSEQTFIFNSSLKKYI